MQGNIDWNYRVFTEFFFFVGSVSLPASLAAVPRRILSRSNADVPLPLLAFLFCFLGPFFFLFSSVEKKNNSVKLPIHNEKLGKNPVMGRPLRGDSPENNGKSNSMEI